MNHLTFCLLTLVATVALAESPIAATPNNAPAEPPAMQPPHESIDIKGSIKMPKVTIVEPKDGATVPTKFKAKFAVEGMKVASSGTVTPGTGHHHLIVDGGPIPKGKVVPTDATHLHFGKGQAETELTLAPGPHTLTLQFADGAHVSYGEMMSQTIKINVK